MKAVVTGGAGFIGSNVVDLLVELGHEVVVVDNLSTGKAENVNSLAVLCEVDLLSPEFETVASELFPETDVVYHLAALPRVEPSIQDPVSFNEVNVTATVKLFDAARRYGVKKVVYSSSSSVYGDAENVPTDETEPTDPMSPYALQKLIGDEYAQLFCRLYDMDITCLRYFNVYGNREPTEGAYVPVIGIWFRQLAEGKALTITGDGKQSRDFINVRDVARSNVVCGETDLKGYQVFNIGSGKTYELNKLAALISDNTTYIAPRIEPKHTCANVSKLKEATGWEPVHSIESYISTKKAEIEDRK